ncbi:T9SS type A sorting domain-containing protein [candidate division WOR-3 bacterium]|nr:T9SS type A sorting domain-containing protein [candidate division WOR-3 bacterium]
MKMLCVLFSLVLAASMLLAVPAGLSDGVGYTQTIYESPSISLPPDLNVENATSELVQAKECGDLERANELSLLINAWWKQNRVQEFDPSETGSAAENTRLTTEELDDHISPTYYAPLWGTDVRIDPRDDCYGGNIVSLSNGDLYSIFVYYSSPNYYRVTRRSTNGGQTWSTCNEISFTNDITYPRLSVADDTLVMSYAMENSSSEWQLWVKTTLPGASLNDLTWGSPSNGYTSDYIRYAVVTNDGPNYNSKWIYATWTQGHTTGTDHTYIRFARSSDMDVSTWEINDTLGSSSGDNIFYYGTDIENGDGTRLVLVVALHPSGWPQSFDEYVRSLASSNGGSSWSSFVNITDGHNNLDENQPSIAGSHVDSTWFCILRVADTTYSTQHLYNYYSINHGAAWTEDAWVTAFDDCFLPHVYIDYNTSDVFAVFRVDNGSSEEVRYKEGRISAPTLWSTSVVINDNTNDLSSVYGPKVCFDYARTNACVMWTDYSSNYSVWFDRTDVTGVEEEPVTGDIEGEAFAVSQTGKNFRITYSVASAQNVSIDVFDVTGRNVAQVFNGTRQPGTYTVDFTPDFAQGSYFFTLSTPQGIQTRRVFLAE